MGKRKLTKEEEAEKIKKKLRKWEKRLKRSQDSASGSQTPPLPEDPANSEENTTTISDDEAPEELILALGPEGADKKETGEPLQQTLASRWQNIMRGGLNKEIKEQIFKKYPTPENLLVTAPTLNPEIKAIMSEISIKRDNRIVFRQNMAGKLLAAIGKPLSNILKGNINSKDLVEHLSDAAKIGAEIFYQDSMSRRYFALAGTTPVVKDAIKNEKPDEWLFGKTCAEKIKLAQTIQKTGSQIKEKQKNYKSPLPLQQKQRSGPYHQSRGQAATRAPQRQQQQLKKRTQTQEQRKRSPPRKQRHRN